MEASPPRPWLDQITNVQEISEDEDYEGPSTEAEEEQADIKPEQKEEDKDAIIERLQEEVKRLKAESFDQNYQMKFLRTELKKERKKVKEQESTIRSLRDNANATVSGEGESHSSAAKDKATGEEDIKRYLETKLGESATESLEHIQKKTKEIERKRRESWSKGLIAPLGLDNGVSNNGSEPEEGDAPKEPSTPSGPSDEQEMTPNTRRKMRRASDISFLARRMREEDKEDADRIANGRDQGTDYLPFVRNGGVSLSRMGYFTPRTDATDFKMLSREVLMKQAKRYKEQIEAERELMRQAEEERAALEEELMEVKLLLEEERRKVDCLESEKEELEKHVIDLAEEMHRETSQMVVLKETFAVKTVEIEKERQDKLIEEEDTAKAEIQQLGGELAQVKQELFFALAVALKLNLLASGNGSQLQYPTLKLFEKAMRDGVDHKQWHEWIPEQLEKQRRKKEREKEKEENEREKEESEKNKKEEKTAQKSRGPVWTRRGRPGRQEQK